MSQENINCVYKCVEYLTAMPMRLLSDKEEKQSNRKFIKWIKTAVEKERSNQYE